MRGGAGRRPLEVVSVGEGVELTARLGRTLDRTFGTRWRPGPPLALDTAWYDAERRQWLSTRLVDALIDRWERGGSHGWLLGITDADLYVPGRTFVFGEATMDGPCALVSLARLRRGADRTTLSRRLLVEATHELGHLAGLDHCPHPFCAMALSEDVDAVDAKPPELCTACRALLLHHRVPTP